jgi:hypothetical protein
MDKEDSTGADDLSEQVKPQKTPAETAAAVYALEKERDSTLAGWRGDPAFPRATLEDDAAPGAAGTDRP